VRSLPGWISPTNPRGCWDQRVFSVVRGAGWFFFVTLAGGLGALPHSSYAEGFGPLPVRNFQPIQMLVLGMPGDRATVLRQGTVDVRVELADTASIFNELTPQSSTVMKFETLRSGLFLRYGVTDQFEVAMEVPALYRYQGVMNGLITATERATTGLSGARRDLRNLGYAYTVSPGGRTAFHGGQDQWGIGDISLFSKYQFVRQTETLPAVSLRVAVKAPSGDASRVFGSGHPDAGVGLALEKTLMSHWVTYVNVNAVIPSGPIGGFHPQPVLSAMTAVEYLWSERASLTLQFDYYSSAFHGTGLKVLDRGTTEMVLGFNYQLQPHLLWQVYAVENVDFITGGSADFTLSTVLTYRFES
jgi:Protein of unknown function (DUF3187)